MVLMTHILRVLVSHLSERPDEVYGYEVAFAVFYSDNYIISTFNKDLKILFWYTVEKIKYNFEI